MLMAMKVICLTGINILLEPNQKVFINIDLFYTELKIIELFYGFFIFIRIKNYFLKSFFMLTTFNNISCYKIIFL